MALILLSYTLALLSPPPSLRDTSASGGHAMTISPIVTQSLSPEWRLWGFFDFLRLRQVWCSCPCLCPRQAHHPVIGRSLNSNAVFLYNERCGISAVIKRSIVSGKFLRIKRRNLFLKSSIILWWLRRSDFSNISWHQRDIKVRQHGVKRYQRSNRDRCSWESATVFNKRPWGLQEK